MKCKLTPAIQEKIGANIQLGMSLKNSALAAGISESTFYDWLSKGEQTARGKYAEFSEYITESKAIAEQLQVQIIHKAADGGDWKAAQFILERRFPDEWGRIDKLDISGKMKTEVDHGPLSDEVLEARNAYLKAVSNAKKKESAAAEDK